MPRIRLGVALVLPEPAASEVDGLRRALGDPTLDRIMPHLTLVPPVNVRLGDLGTALRILREAAGATAPLVVRLGPVATFHPVTPVLYLGVDPGSLGPLTQLRDAVFHGPLARPLTHDFVPHVTLSADAGDDRIEAATLALGAYQREVELAGVTLLQQGPSPDRRWTVLADASFVPPAVVGRGGLPVELWTSSVCDPEAMALFEGDDPLPPVPDGARGVVVTGRRDGAVLGVAAGWHRDGTAEIDRMAVAPGELADVERHLSAAFDSFQRHEATTKPHR